MSTSNASRSIVRRSSQRRSQSQFDFNRAAKLAMLDRIVIPAEVLETHRENIGSARGLLIKVKALLRSIDSFAREDSECFASVKKIGEQVGSSERTTQRYLKIAKLLGLITVINGRHHTTSIHDINWSLVLDWSRPSTNTNEGRQQRDEGRQESHPGVTTTPMRGDNPVTQIAINRQEAQIKTPSKRDGVLKSLGESDKSQPPDGGTQRCGGWPEPITVEILRDREQVTRLFDFAVERGWVHQDDRHRFHTLAKYCFRAAHEGRIKNAGATFTKNVKDKNWNGSNGDEQSAIRPTSRTSASDNGDLLIDAPLDRESQIELLKRKFAKSTAATLAIQPTAQSPPTDASDPVPKETDTPRHEMSALQSSFTSPSRSRNQ